MRGGDVVTGEKALAVRDDVRGCSDLAGPIDNALARIIATHDVALGGCESF